MQIYVKTSDGETITVEVESSDSIMNLKNKLGDKLKISPEQIKLMFAGKELDDSRTLSDCKITEECTVHMSLLLKGGSCDFTSFGTEFVDVSNQAGMKTIPWSKNGAPKWLEAGRGLCLEGTCLNSQCIANGKRVIMHIGYEKFDLVLDANESTTKCPMCLKYVDPDTCAFNNCWWNWSGIKQTAKTKAPIKCSGDWKYADDAYHYFDKQESGTVMWKQLILEAVKDKPI